MIMTMDNFVDNIQDIMRNDEGLNGNAQRIEQMAWILFLKIYSILEKEWEIYESNYISIIPPELNWESWAVDYRDGNALTGDELIFFVNNDLFPILKNLEINENSTTRHIIVKEVFSGNGNYMKNGVLLRQVINIIDEINFDDYKNKHAFGNIYEIILKDLQNAKDSGEFYTPRAVTDFMAKKINPKLGDSIADFACGTGGFLTSTLKLLDSQINSVDDRVLYDNSIFGIEKKGLPYVLCITNMLIHGIENPNILHGNALSKNIKEYGEDEKFDIILMNPPYGGSEIDSIKHNFPINLRSNETADLFMALILYRLKQNGRCAIVLPDGFLFGTDNAKIEIKKKLLNECNLHTIVRLPPGVFAPYTPISTNLLFFDKTHKTEEIWYYRVDPPKGYKNFTKTVQLQEKHLVDLESWWDNREEIIENGYEKSRKYLIEDIIKNNYDLDLCKEEKDYFEKYNSPKELIDNYFLERENILKEMDSSMNDIKKLLDID